MSKPGVHAAPEENATDLAAWTLDDLGVRHGAHGGASGEPVNVPPLRLEAELELAYQRGFTEGFLEGERAAAAQAAGALAAAERAVEAIGSAEACRASALEEDLCALAVAIARQIVMRQLELEPALVTRMVQSALELFPLPQPLRVRINPEDLRMISATLAAGTEGAPGADGREIRWVPDPRIESGGCVVEGRDRIVDGRVDRSLERIYRRMIDGAGAS